MRIKKNHHFAFLFLAGILLLLPACKKEDQQKKASTEPRVLAEVNGGKITSDDLSIYIESSVGRDNADKMDAEARKKALEALVLSRIMAQTMEKKLDEKEKALLGKKVSAYREQLLVRKYMMDEIPPSPVTKEMIEEYYRANPEKFGASLVRRFEILGSDTSLSGNGDASVIQALKSLSGEKDWKAAAEVQDGKALRLFFREGWSNTPGLDPGILNLIKSLGQGEVSGVTFMDSKPCIIRISEEKQTQARPLASVEEDIRKMLFATQVSNAVKNAKDGLLKAAKVKYTDERAGE